MIGRSYLAYMGLSSKSKPALLAIAQLTLIGSGGGMLTMRRKMVAAAITATSFLSFATSVGMAIAGGAVPQACGKVDGVPIHAHNISCKTARHVYRADMAGKLPAGWSCSASLARCYHGEVGRSSEYMWWRRTTYRLLTTADVVLGGVVYGGEHGEGWGTSRPKTIYNGGDPSGLISDVHWSRWGAAVARGHGRNSVFKPHGGYYRHQVTIQLKAKRIGSCEGRSAYLKLFIREPRKPGGPLGPWRSWSGPRRSANRMPETVSSPWASAFV
jgi:hypothetical protein